MNSIAPNMVTFTRAATAAIELFALIDRESKINPLDNKGEIPSGIEGTIDIRGVSFSYPMRPDVKVLDNYSLHVPAGKVTALVVSISISISFSLPNHDSGYQWFRQEYYCRFVGAMVQSRFGKHQTGRQRYRHNQSEVVANKHSPCSAGTLTILPAPLRYLLVLTYIQEPVLFNGTVLDNICNGLAGTPWENGTREERLERVQAAAKMAFAHEFIEDLPLGYDTNIGEMGGLLSGGQKQRIAIARSIISQPRILLLDEATSALDPHAEGIVQRALDEASKNRTTIVIAHKLKTIQNADNIVVMKHGTIVEQGSHHELVARGDVYATLVKAQDLASSDSGSGSDNEGVETPMVEPKRTISLARLNTAKSSHSSSLEAGGYQEKGADTSVIVTAWKLMKATKHLKSWYIASVVACLLGGKSGNPQDNREHTENSSWCLSWTGSFTRKDHDCARRQDRREPRQFLQSHVFRHGHWPSVCVHDPRVGK